MTEGTCAFFILVLGKTLGAHLEILEKQKKRLKLHQVYSEDECDVVLGFVPIVSRAGTDIEAALEKIPKSRPVVLIVIHNTFDPDYVVPDSKLNVKQHNNVLAVDFLSFEQQGLLQCQKNDMSAKAITDHLIALGASPQDRPAALPMPGYNCANQKTLMFLFVFFLIVMVIVALSVILYKKFTR